MMRLCAITYCYRRLPAVAAAERLRDLGWPAVEVFCGHGPESDFRRGADPAALRAALAAAGVAPVAYHLGGCDAAGRADIPRAFACACALGAGVLVGCATPEVVPDLQAAAAEYNLPFGIENHQGNVFETPDDLLAVLRPGTRVGVNFDTGHFAAAGVDPVAALERLRDFVVHVHLKDIAARASSVQQSTALGRGAAGLDAFLPALAATAYAGWASVEHEGDDPTDDLRTSQAWLQERLRAL